jgi:hypothetical protein
MTKQINFLKFIKKKIPERIKSCRQLERAGAWL